MQMFLSVSRSCVRASYTAAESQPTEHLPVCPELQGTQACPREREREREEERERESMMVRQMGDRSIHRGGVMKTLGEEVKRQ